LLNRFGRERREEAGTDGRLVAVIAWRSCVALVALGALLTPHGAVADHGSAPPQPVFSPGPPLPYCRPVHLSSEPGEFRPGDVAQRFRIFVDRDCRQRRETVTVEIWYRALYYDGGRPAYGSARIVTAVRTRTDLAATQPGSRLSHFDLPGNAFHLHGGCYIGRVRGAAESSVGIGVEKVADIEACATPPRLSLPAP
jgi:hypothetical protein